ncbi:MAG: P1 family peptidase [Acidobacteria bacterium]|nr:P1 family peptidase [Acidobacteriota bacterium]
MVGYLTDIPGIKVGHFTSNSRPTGCTVVLVEKGAIAGVDVRGGAPGTKETDLLNPINTVQMVHGIVLSGGSAFGLDTASGVMRYLEEKDIGFDTKVAYVPIVPAAVIFDLQLGDSKIRPTAEDGYQAAKIAKLGAFALGSVGAGAGATVGKLFGAEHSTRGGLGTASIRLDDLIIAALVVVNAAGDIIDPQTGSCIAGARSKEGDTLLDSMAALKAGRRPSVFAAQNTTLAIVATNAKLTKPKVTKLASMAHDGLSRTINPVHTPLDGDTIFALSTGDYPHYVDMTTLGALAADVVASAVLNAIQRATAYESIPAAADLFKI